MEIEEVGREDLRDVLGCRVVILVRRWGGVGELIGGRVVFWNDLW